MSPNWVVPFVFKGTWWGRFCIYAAFYVLKVHFEPFTYMVAGLANVLEATVIAGDAINEVVAPA